MNENDQYEGRVHKGEFWFMTTPGSPERKVGLTTISMEAALKPETNRLSLSEYEGRNIVVEGHLSGDWIYSAVVKEGADRKNNS